VATELVINRWCDRASVHQGARREGENFIIKIGPHPMAEIDLCSDCQDELVDNLVEALLEYGRKPSAEAIIKREKKAAKMPVATKPGEPDDKPKAVRNYPCILCPGTPDLVRNGSLGRHLASEHGFTDHGHGKGAPATIVFGELCPICGASSQRLGSHAHHSHQLETAAQLFQVARDKGDPHGIVRARFGDAAFHDEL
jgi:hypothetical protein